METPYITHLTSDDFKYVYEPAEDSFLLIDALESEIKNLNVNPPGVIVEVGPGSGIVITAVAKVFNTSVCFGVDINAHACRVSRKTAEFNKATNVDFINADLLAAFQPNSIDVLIFNPPYVLTPEAEITEKTEETNEFNENIIKSWAGGADGRTIMNKFFLQLNEWLTTDGCAYVLVIKDNKPEQIVLDLKGLNFAANIIAERKIRGEHLFVLKIKRIH